MDAKSKKIIEIADAALKARWASEDAARAALNGLPAPPMTDYQRKMIDHDLEVMRLKQRIAELENPPSPPEPGKPPPARARTFLDDLEGLPNND